MNKKLEWLESIRGIACLIVFLAHIISRDFRIGIYASGCGKIGVWVFMLISGMLSILPYIHNENLLFHIKKLPNYYVKKILKIYPSYLVAILMAWILGFIEFESIPKYIFIIETWGHLWFMPVIIKF